MASKHYVVPVGTTTTDVLASAPDGQGYEGVSRSVILTNEGASDVLLGDPGTTASSYGFRLKPQERLALDLTRTDTLHGVTASGTSNVRVLALGV